MPCRRKTQSRKEAVSEQLSDHPFSHTPCIGLLGPRSPHPRSVAPHGWTSEPLRNQTDSLNTSWHIRSPSPRTYRPEDTGRVAASHNNKRININLILDIDVPSASPPPHSRHTLGCSARPLFFHWVQLSALISATSPRIDNSSLQGKQATSFLLEEPEGFSGLGDGRRAPRVAMGASWRRRR